MKFYLIFVMAMMPLLKCQRTDTIKIFVEHNGLIAVEAEHFVRQDSTSIRQWYLISTGQSELDITPDADPSHAETASGGAYIEILPDTRQTHDDELINGVSFSNVPGRLGILTYNVEITNPGRYYVWVRAFSTGSEDNGLHVGIDGNWPETGQRLQWCDGKQQWWWESKQRTEDNHCGEPHDIYLDIDEPGVHTIHFSMREDGFEFDKWLMTTDINFERPMDEGPAERWK